MHDPLEALEDYLSNVETKSVEVKLRAGAKPLRLFYTPMTSGEMSQIQKKHPDFPSTSIEALIDLIIIKAMNEDGSKAYTIEHKPKLRRIPHQAVYEIAGPMMASATEEQLEGN
tara:strand:- start:1038 stop:1379 length:342 start_codon:yes stop_codon:yes gene_type:complete